MNAWTQRLALCIPTFFLAILLLAGCEQPDDGGAVADLVLTNGKISTVDDAMPEAQALAVLADTIVAVGTSLPELAASVMSALKKEADIAIGNIIGSNLFNTLGVLAISGILQPARLPGAVLQRDYPVMLGLTGLLFIMAYGFRGPGRINRIECGLLLSAFGGYQVLIFLSVTPS